MEHEKYMKIAIEEAKKGIGWTNPNPVVGAVIVKNKKIISKDYHHQYGGYHAEKNAIEKSGGDLNSAVLYTTLEPCCHYGKTPPCTELIIKSGIKTVVIGSYDPNPKVYRNGIRILEEHGITVITNILKDECDRLNTVYFHFIKTKKPYVIMKYAMTADGKIAACKGRAKHISGEISRERVQQTRKSCSAIMAGVNTILLDDPLLTCRLPDSRNPVRIICDTALRTPMDSQIIKTAGKVPTIIATCCGDLKRQQLYKDKGCEIARVNKRDGHVDLKELMTFLGNRDIDSVLLEGGSELNFSALSDGIVNKVQAYIAPKLFGGEMAKTPAGGCGMQSETAFMLSAPEVTVCGNDVRIEWEVLPCLQG